jgi:NADH-quinone oxidoreductase subunit H
VVGGIVLVMLLIVAFLLPQGESKPSAEKLVLPNGSGRDFSEVPTAGSDYPLPPLDLVVPASPPRRAAMTASGVNADGVAKDGSPIGREDGHGTS